ncbi:MAG TPA: hypothetical protein VNJ09_11305 [Chthonomonadales bacterium]|nr:hypothetical protein [Chthonomonadales bacterium]
MNVSSHGVLNAVEASLLRAAESNVEVAAKLLKKALDTDKNTVQTLLSPNNSSRLDIRA